MRKIYRYKNLSYAVADDDEVQFTVQFISDGNISHTVINIPGPDDPEIANEGSQLLGTGKKLRGDFTISVSDIANPIPNEDTIIIRYLVNDKILVEHSNKKSETDRPYVILFISFPQPINS